MIRFIRGPIFANIMLADEINRTPPKTQAALLEAMQEYQVTVNGVRFELERPLFVLATQNPIEQEGTYPLPEAQLDRFMFNVVIDYPTRRGGAADPRARRPATRDPPIAVVATGEEIERLHAIVRDVPAAENVDRLRRAAGARDAAGGRATARRRTSCASGCAGAPARGPGRRCCSAPRRARCSRAAAWSSLEDVRAVALPVLRHRVLLNFQAEADGIDADAIVAAAARADPLTDHDRGRSTRACCRRSPISSWSPASPSTAPSPGCIAARSTATAPSSASTATIAPATT